MPRALAPPVAALLACACSAPVPSPMPTGPHPVGETLLHLVDPDRDEPITPGDDRREVTVRLWYPAAREGEPAGYVPDLDELKKALDGRTTRLFRHVEVTAALDVGVADVEGPLPVVVFSPGNDRIAAESAFLVEELASHGFAVVGVDHAYDARAVALADGTAVAHAEDDWPALPPPAADGVPDPDSAYLRYYAERVDVRAADASFVLDRLAADDPLGGALDLQRVGFVGHSVGGVAAGTFCATDPRAAACANLDGDTGLGPYLQTFVQPYLVLTKAFSPSDAELRGWGLERDAWEAQLEAHRDELFGALSGGSWRIELAEATHESFTDEPYALAALRGDPTAGHARRMEQIRSYTIAFFDRFLRDGPGAELDETPPDDVSVDRW